MLAAPLALALLVPAAPPTELPPGLVAYEPFDLPPGTYVLGSDRGAGWDGPWFATQEPLTPPDPRFPRRADHLLVMADSLTAPGAVSAGGSASSIAADPPKIGVISRKLADARSRPGQVTYISVLVKSEGRLHAGTLDGFFKIMLEQHSLPKPHITTRQWVGFGKPWGFAHLRADAPWAGAWCLVGQDFRKPLLAAGRPVLPGVNSRTDRGGLGSFGEHHLSSGTRVTPGKTTRLVLRMECSAKEPTALFTLAVDPDPARPEPPPAAALLTGWALSADPPVMQTWVTVASSAAFTIDEVRVADTFAAAVGAPPEAD